ncbi:DUF1499 domain-containing protein [Aliiroseovarius lamellibrachiae]|uniref:DUF1499 domain-containing protein n=1 Tax=Aliiroseovarius lamellibrachiae TaxID=1924933 RepID=UPI001BE0911F|nr:DUF1499 domain-containing protein [Aliiroseovarius lamellibrachiae]MBT2132590.1 DUF1499 domain-containing protein [Aliiroseovarius lamellibrachiae]
MKTLMIGAGIVLFLVVGVALFARVKPLPSERFSGWPGPNTPGKHMLVGGVKYVLPLADLPNNALAQLAAIIKASPRSVPHETQKGRAFVTRSKVFGFPDITLLWEQDGQLHIHAHLVIGKSDLGVNAARVDGWLEQLVEQP